MSKALPHFTEGEKAILGGILINNSAMPHVLAMLSRDDFYHETHRVIFDAMLDLFKSESPIDWNTVTKKLKDNNQLGKVGGVAFLTQLADAVPSTANIKHYATNVKDYSNRRQIIAACNEATNRCHDDTETTEILSSLEQSCYSILTEKTESGLTKFKDINIEAFSRLSKRVNKKTPPGIPTGFDKFDHRTGGFRPTDLIVCGARPSMGKTAFALDISLNVAGNGYLVMIFSLEMSKDDLWDRLITKKSKVPLERIRSGFLDQKEIAIITTASGAMEDINLVIDDTPGLTPTEIYARVNSWCVRWNCKPDLIVIDYLQLMQPDRKYASQREREVAETIRSFKIFTKRLACPFLVLSQLKREVDSRPIDNDGRIPQMHDFRESGAIEQDGDILFGLYRRGQYTRKEYDKNHALVRIQKQRNGPIGDIPLFWDPPVATFKSMTSRAEEPDSSIDNMAI